MGMSDGRRYTHTGILGSVLELERWARSQHTGQHEFGPHENQRLTMILREACIGSEASREGTRGPWAHQAASFGSRKQQRLNFGGGLHQTGGIARGGKRTMGSSSGIGHGVHKLVHMHTRHHYVVQWKGASVD